MRLTHEEAMVLLAGFFDERLRLIASNLEFGSPAFDALEQIEQMLPDVIGLAESGARLSDHVADLLAVAKEHQL